MNHRRHPTAESSRRDFLKTSTAAALGAAAATNLGVLQSAYAAGSDILRVGLVGCGGRGTGAAQQALQADPHTELIAMADVFADHLESSLKRLKASDVGQRVKVDSERRFIGFDACRKLIDSGVDIVLLATPPHFRPEHLKACIQAGKHVFAEKPVAVDAPGVRSVLETTEQARKKDLMIVSGLCWRYETHMQQMIERLHSGIVGQPLTLQATRYGSGVWVKPRRPEWTDMEYQLRNWYYYTWLSGDFIVEQFIHELDNLSWAINDRSPVRAYGTGGRQTRTGPEHGHIYDHFAVVYEYADGQKMFATTRHQRGCHNENTVYVTGTHGTADLRKYRITGANSWRLGARRRTNMHQLEHDAMYDALRKGRIINNGRYMANSTMLAILGRMVAYTGKEITWQQAIDSEESLGPPRYDWERPLPEPELAMPGITPFV